MRVRTVLVALTLAAGPIPAAAGASTASPAPGSDHEAVCNRVHNSTAPADVDRALHERIPRPALNQVCDPHSGHRDDPDPD
jgi:hypothetical protein